MAELATIAVRTPRRCSRPPGKAIRASWPTSSTPSPRWPALPEVRQLADNPKVEPATVYDVIVGALKAIALAPTVQNLLRTVIDNGRLEAMPEIAAQYRALVNEMTGVSDATVYSAYPLDGAQLADVVPALEKRFNRKLNPNVVVEPQLIGGIRVVVGDEVLDTSVKARLEQMKSALTALMVASRWR
jgi:F-type H+-transporting ATPase subunit delta